MVFLKIFAEIITANKTKKAPKLDAITNDQFEIEFVTKKLPNTDEPNIKIATPRLAPDETPNTKGPASGFLNNVCINKPQTDKPEPTKRAVIALGNLKSKIIVCQLSFEIDLPVKIFIMSSKGIETDPKLIFKKKKTINKTDNNIKLFLIEMLVDFFNFKAL
tara:strand:+ start:1036 stop:1521 length:486 start_codon:yes stop_codon:yes gene_type:complete